LIRTGSDTDGRESDEAQHGWCDSKSDGARSNTGQQRGKLFRVGKNPFFEPLAEIREIFLGELNVRDSRLTNVMEDVAGA